MKNTPVFRITPEPDEFGNRQFTVRQLNADGQFYLECICWSVESGHRIARALGGPDALIYVADPDADSATLIQA